MKPAETIHEYHDLAKTCLQCVEQFWLRCVIGEAGAESIGLILESLAITLESEPAPDANVVFVTNNAARSHSMSPYHLGGQVGSSVHDAVFRFGTAVIRSVEVGLAQMATPPQDPLSWSGENVEALRPYIEHDLANAIQIDVQAIKEAAIMLQNEFAAANPAEPQSQEPPPPDPPKGVVHSKDFRSVNWFGTEYTFTPMQAACVKVLYEHWRKGAPDVGDAYLEEAAGCSRFYDIFRQRDAKNGMHPAWGTMIVRGKKGTRRLKQPEE